MSNLVLGCYNHFLITESYKKVSTFGRWLAAFLVLAWPDAKMTRASEAQVFVTDKSGAWNGKV
jgi:hypothetical protein